MSERFKNRIETPETFIIGLINNRFFFSFFTVFVRLCFLAFLLQTKSKTIVTNIQTNKQETQNPNKQKKGDVPKSLSLEFYVDVSSVCTHAENKKCNLFFTDHWKQILDPSFS